MSWGATERASIDARFSVRGAQPPPRGVVVVGVDAQTLGALDVRPPLPRDLHARMIDRLRRAGARVIAYDFGFTEPGPDADADDQLIRAARRAKNLVLATTKVSAAGETDVFGDPAAPAASANFDVSGDDVIVMSGNVGSQRRLEYTAVGDTTNTASRLQAATKDAGCSLLVSEATRDALRVPAEDLVSAGTLALRGREAPVAVWTLATSGS